MPSDFNFLNSTLTNSSHIPLDVSYGSIATFIKGALVLLLRAGYILIQLGSIPVENIYLILLQNILDIAVTLSAFGLIGFSVAYGYDVGPGLTGYGMWAMSTPANLDEAITGFSACLIGSAIITTLLSGRCHCFGYLLISLLYSSLCLPILIHWIWSHQGWMRHHVILLETLVSVKDHAGCLVVHFSSGLIGFIGSAFLGRRLIRLKEIDESSIGPESSGSTIIGYIFIMVGLIGFTLPTPIYEATHISANYVGIVLVNNIMAIAAGIVVAVVLQFLCYRKTFNYWSILRCIQGAIAGIVTISAGVEVYTPLISYVCSSLGAFVFYITVVCVHNSFIEDYCNIIAIHLTCGLLGTLLPPLVASRENLSFDFNLHTRSIHLLWQLICLSIIALCLIVIFSIIFLMLCLTRSLRNKNEEINHRRGTIASSKLGKQYFLNRLFAVDQSTSFIEPGTVGKTTEELNERESATESNEVPVQVRFLEKDEGDGAQVEKVRFVYTVCNGESKIVEKNIGDALDKVAVKKLSKIPVIKANKRDPSCYDLHKTEKSTSLVKCNGRWKNRKHNKRASEFHDVERSIELLSYGEVISKDVMLKLPLDNCVKCCDEVV